MGTSRERGGDGEKRCGARFPLFSSASCLTQKRDVRWWCRADRAVAAETRPSAGRCATMKRAKQLFARKRTSCEHVGGKVRVCEHHASDADEIGESLTQVVLRHVWQPFLQIGVAGADEGDIRKRALQRSGDRDVARDAAQRILRRLVAVARWKKRRPQHMRVVVGTAGGDADPAHAQIANSPSSWRALERRVTRCRSSASEREFVAVDVHPGTAGPSAVLRTARVTATGASRDKRRCACANAFDDRLQEARAIRDGPRSGRAAPALSHSWTR